MNVVELDGQYRAVREEAGMAWRPGGRVAATGPDAAEYLQGQVTNDTEALEPGAGCYSALLNRKGRMQADMTVLCLAPDKLWLELEVDALPAVLRHLTLYSVGRDVAIEDASDAARTLALAGPAAAERAELPPLGAEHSHAAATVDGIDVRVVRTNLGLDLLVAPDDADALVGALTRRGVAEVNEDAMEILRVEGGRPRFGHEMTTETIPQEADINDRAISFTKGCYIGQETVARLHYKGKPNRHLRGLRLPAPATAGATVALGERELGRIGTAVLSPALGPIALAVLRREAEPGVTVTVAGDAGDELEAEVVELPFADDR